MGRSLISLIILGVILVGGYYAEHHQTNIAAAFHVQDPVCKADTRDHVYNADRLHLIDSCIKVTGTIESVRYEADGDLHVLLRLDPAFVGLTNDGNTRYQRGDLVVEPVCVNVPTQRDAISTCDDTLPGGIDLPKVGQHVSVTGPYVTDSQHHDWAEIHPAWAISPI